MARKIQRINSINIVPHKNGLDISAITINFTLLDDSGNYMKQASYTIVLSTLSAIAKTAVLALIKTMKDTIETRESLSKQPDPTIKDLPLKVF